MSEDTPLNPDVADLMRTAFLPETTEGDGGVIDSVVARLVEPPGI